MRHQTRNCIEPDLYAQRISRRVIAEQHLALTDSFHDPFHFPEVEVENDPKSEDFIGEIFLRCKAKEVVERCARVTRELMQKTHGKDCPLPKVKIQGHLDATFPFILSHLEYIVGELLRNSIQAVMEQMYKKEVSEVPPIEVLICETPQHVIMRISDQGGGIPPEIFPHLWSFSKGPRRQDRLKNLNQVPRMAATMQELRTAEKLNINETKEAVATNPIKQSSSDQRSSSLSSLTSRKPDLRLGIGLPMSKIYAEYWAGSLEIHSLEGYGVDAFLQISKLGNKNEQLTTRASMDSI